MSIDNAIHPKGPPEDESPQGQITPPSPESVEPDDANDSLSAEAKAWRLKYRDAQTTAAEAIRGQVDVAAKLQQAQRQLVDQHIGSKIINADDFHSRVDHSEMLAEDGTVDLARVDAALGGVLAANPHYAPPPPGTPLVAPASAVAGAFGAGDSRIGFPNGSVLNPAISGQHDATWTDVFDAANKQR